MLVGAEGWTAPGKRPGVYSLLHLTPQFWGSTVSRIATSLCPTQTTFCVIRQQVKISYTSCPCLLEASTHQFPQFVHLVAQHTRDTHHRATNAAATCTTARSMTCYSQARRHSPPATWRNKPTRCTPTNLIRSSPSPRVCRTCSSFTRILFCWNGMRCFLSLVHTLSTTTSQPQVGLPI